MESSTIQCLVDTTWNHLKELLRNVRYLVEVEGFDTKFFSCVVKTEGDTVNADNPPKSLSHSAIAAVDIVSYWLLTLRPSAGTT